MLHLETRTEHGDFVGVDVYSFERGRENPGERVGWIELSVRNGEIVLEYSRADEAAFGPIKIAVR